MHTYSADLLLSWEIVSVDSGSFSIVLTSKKNINNKLIKTQYTQFLHKNFKTHKKTDIWLTSVLDHDSEIGLTNLPAYVFKQLFSAGPLTEPMGHTGQHGIQPLLLKWRDRTLLNTLFQEQEVQLQTVKV